MNQRRPNLYAESAARLWRGLVRSIPPMPALGVAEWAERHRVLSKGVSYEHGKYRCDRVPYLRPAMDDITDKTVTDIIWCFAAQTGKSETMNNVIGYYTHGDPASVLMVQPTIHLAKEYSKDRIDLMYRDCPALKELILPARSRDSGNTTLSKRFPGGSLAIAGANAPSGLAGRPRRVVLLDEVDRFPTSAGKEGDPCALADKRTEAFPNAVKLKTSTPTVKGASRIWSLLEQSDFQKLFCKCPKCEHAQVWMWDQVKWPTGKPEEAWLECANPVCRHALTDEERVASVRAGEWRATQPFTGMRGRWLNGINTLFQHHNGFRNRLHEFAAEFLKAKAGGVETMRVWVNTFLAECFEEEVDVIKPNALEERAENYAPDELPEKALLLVAGVDVQGDRIECTVWAYGMDDEAWAVEHRVFHGDPDKDEVWQSLDTYLLQEFEREDGCKLKIERAFIDMGHKNRRTLAFCQPRIGRGVFPCRGVNRVGTNVPPLLPARPSMNNRAKIPHWNVGVTVAKTTIYDRLRLTEAGPRFIHFPKGCGFDAAWFKQLTAEKRKTKYSAGVAYFIFEKDNNSVRNEALDLAVYALAAMDQMGRVNWKKLAENRKASIARDVTPKPETKSTEKTEAAAPDPIAAAQPQAPKEEPAATMDEAGKIEHVMPPPPVPEETTAPLVEVPRPARPVFRRRAWAARW